MIMRECNGCGYCCDGHLIGEVDGKRFGEMQPCHNLASFGCKVHNDRPPMCSNYFCAWSQELLPLWMKPDECGVVVSVETDKSGKQYLKAVSTKTLSFSIVMELDSFTKRHNTYFVTVKVIPVSSIK